MNDFTLVIPTHNRPPLLGRLLRYLKATGANWPIIVLDSSQPDLRELNVRNIEESGLAIDYADYPDIPVHEKWRLGIHRVITPYCALCADDDLVITRSMDRCLAALRTNPSASVAQGYSFSFDVRSDQELELNNIAYYSDSIEGTSPLERLGALFAHYQTPSYGFYRTRLLQKIFDALQPLSSFLSRELLWSALAATAGQIIRVPCFWYGRNMGLSGDYEYWHPLEWVCKNPASLFGTYVHNRDILASAVLAHPENSHSADQTKRILDLIHMRYLVKHAPDSAMGFILGQQLSGADFKEYWLRPEINLPLHHAAAIGSKASNTLAPITWRGNARSYILHPHFYEPAGIEKLNLLDISSLIEDLEHYSAVVAC